MRVWLACGLGLALLLSAACIIPFVYYPGGGDWGQRVQTFHKVIALGPGGTISLDNINGDLDIRGWDGEEVEITAEESRSGLFDMRSWDFYGRSEFRPKVEVDQFEKFVKIQARASEDETNARPVHFRISVPHSINLDDIRIRSGAVFIADLFGNARVELEEGDITVENFSGSLDLSLWKGSADAEVLDLRKDDDVRITTRKGDITLHLQDGANVRIEAATEDGEVTSEFDLGQKLPAQKVSGRLGAGEATVSLTTLQGNVKLRRVK